MIRAGLPPAERPMRWVIVEIDAGPFLADGDVTVSTAAGPAPQPTTFTTRDGEVTALYSTMQMPDSAGGDHGALRRLDWLDDGLFVPAQSFNVDLDETLTILEQLALVPKTEFAAFQLDHSLTPVCARIVWTASATSIGRLAHALDISGDLGDRGLDDVGDRLWLGDHDHV